jgi:hypothetical protein
VKTIFDQLGVDGAGRRAGAQERVDTVEFLVDEALPPIEGLGPAKRHPVHEERGRHAGAEALRLLDVILDDRLVRLRGEGPMEAVKVEADLRGISLQVGSGQSLLMLQEQGVQLPERR